MYFIYFCSSKKNVEMKKLLVVIGLLSVCFFALAACATREKCPAYGHYTEVVQPIDMETASVN